MFSVEAHPGNKHALFLEHVRDNVCNEDPTRFEYLLNWMALAVQKPDVHAEVAIVLRGPQGLGKGFFAKTLGALFGRHFLTVAHVVHIGFNEHMRDCVVLFVDEDLRLGHERAVKALLTEDMIAVERMGRNVEIVPNRVHLIMVTDAQWVMPTSSYDRRFVIFDMRTRNTVCFGAMDADLKAGGLSNLLHELQTRDLTNFNVFDR